ncbi:MAG: retron St85 family effector protein [Reyranella sp.]|nr:retron St85 family effector protein [Reyranella sp.]
MQPPKKSLFLCGGPIGGTDQPSSLRDYLFRLRAIENELPAAVVLAEAANQLYRDTHYGDLISFEEDIARIASVVLVIAESPGSLAELGAFASSDPIRKALRVIVQEKYWIQESFIRFGPLKRVHEANENHVGIYPWTVNASGQLDVAELNSHYGEIANFVRQQIESVDKTTAYPIDPDTQQFFLLYWIVYLGMATSLDLPPGFRTAD